MRYGKAFRDTWLKCPKCGSETEFKFTAIGDKNIKQDATNRTRRETSFTITDYSDEDTVECLACEYVCAYEQFVAAQSQ